MWVYYPGIQLLSFGLGPYEAWVKIRGSENHRCTGNICKKLPIPSIPESLVSTTCCPLPPVTNRRRVGALHPWRFNIFVPVARGKQTNCQDDAASDHGGANRALSVPGTRAVWKLLRVSISCWFASL